MTTPSQNLSPPPASAVSGTGLRPLLRWWSSELRAMLPAPMARWIDGDMVATDVSVDEYGITITSGAVSAKPLVAGRVSLDGLASNPVLRNLIATGRDRVRLVLTSDQSMVKSISLPIATEENLRDVVGFELDRHTPFTPDQALYDVQIVRRDPQQEKIVITLVVASRAEVAGLLETVRRAGLTCAAIGIQGGVASDAASVDLLPTTEKPPRRLSHVHQINFGLLGFAVLLAFAAIVLPIWQKREATKVLIPQAEKAAAEFKVSERVYSAYTKLAAEYNFLAARKHAFYPVVAVLEELARTFPDTTWVQKLDIKPNGKVREVIILGEAQSTSRVIENLEQSPSSLFQNSKQQSQSTPLQPKTERFHVSAEIKPRPTPAPEGLEDLAGLGIPAVSVPAVPPVLSTPDLGTTSPSAGSGTAPPKQPATAVVTATPVPAPATTKSAPAIPVSPNLPPAGLNPSLGPSSPPPAPFNPLNPPPGALSPPRIESMPPPTGFNPSLGPSGPPPVSFNPLNPPPGPQSPPAIVPIPSSAPPGKRGD